MASDDKYTVSLTGEQVDDALMQMNQRVPEGWAVGTRDGVAVSSTSQFYHNNAKYLATQAKSWAQGGTGERSGEDTNNAQYWAQQAQAAAGGGVSSFKGRTGAVQPQSGDYTADMVGAMPADADIPTKVSDLVNDEQFITPEDISLIRVVAGQTDMEQLGADATAEGRYVMASGEAAHAEGVQTAASGDFAHAEGSYSEAVGDYSHAEGGETSAAGVASHAEGIETVANGEGAHAEGKSTYVGSVDGQGQRTPGGSYGHAEGNNTQVWGPASHAEGEGTIAGGGDLSPIPSMHIYTVGKKAAHAEGLDTVAVGEASHAEGYNNMAIANYSHAEGQGNNTFGRSEHVFGEFSSHSGSSSQANRGAYVEVVGNGTADSSRSNARTLDWDGNEILAGKLTVGAAPTANMDVATKKYVDDAIAAAIAALQNS